MSDIFETIGTNKTEKKNTHHQPPQPDDPSGLDKSKVGEGEGDKKRWGAVGDIYYAINSTFETIPSGLYECRVVSNIGPVLDKRRNDTDTLIAFPDNDTQEIIDEFTQFWEIESEFRKRGFLHKRGFLLWGPPGSGKTSCVQLLIKKLVENYNGINLMIDNPSVAADCIGMLRKIEPNRPIIGLLEDLDSLVQKYDEDEYLSLLDGESQTDNVIFIATTNYPERLDSRFIDRPSRFDTIKFIDMPNAASRRMYLEIKEPSLQGEELDKWVEISEGFSIAHLKELIVAVKCFNQDFDDAVKRLKKMKKREISSNSYDSDKIFGFTNNKNRKND